MRLAQLGCLLWAGVAMAQSGKPVVSSHTGCVMALPDDQTSFVLSEAGACYLLSGKIVTKRLAMHIVTLHGVTTDATQTVPLLLRVEGVDTVGAACQEVCTLEPPGQRGLRKRAKPGTPGGTPGQ